MAEKKITVLGDAGDASLSPEDEHKIEVKIDRMLAIDTDHAQPESKLMEHKPLAAAEPLETVEPAGPPPLSKKVKKIAISDASEEAEKIDLKPVFEEPEPAPVETMPEPTEPSEPKAAPVEAATEHTAVVSEPEQSAEEQSKKYRPPDGPMPFKRASSEPSADVAPEAAASASMTAEEQEDAAIAAAFAAKEPAKAEKTRRQKRRKGKKTAFLLVILILIVGLAAAVLAVPSLRHRLLGDKSTITSKAPATTTTTQPKATTPATTAPLPDIFLAKSDGIYNLYKVDQSGQNKQLLLAGSGYETSPTTQLVANSTASLAALVSLRDNSKDTAGYPLQTLSLVDVTTPAVTKITQAQRLQILGWYGTRVVYVASKTGAATVNDTNSYQLVAYDTATKQSQVLDHATHFNAVLAVHDQLFYATDGATAAVYRIKPDGTGKQTVLTKLVTNIYRTDYNALALATTGGWYTLDVSSFNAAKPVSTVNAYTGPNKLYIDSPDQHTSLHLETQNGIAKLMLYTLATKKDIVLSQQAGLSYPLHWLSNTTAVYRIDTDTQTGDYTVNTTTNASAKLIDTSSFLGLEP